MRLYPRGGYLNPGYGAWGVGVTIQVTVALCLLMLARGHPDAPPTYLDTDRPHRIEYVSTRFFNSMGGLHFIGGGVTLLVVAVGYLALPLALCPLTLVTILNCCLILFTAASCGSILNQVQKRQKTQLQHVRHPELGFMRDSDYSEIWAYKNQVALMYIVSMCVAQVPCYFAGLVYSKSSTTGTRATAWFYASILMVVSGTVLFLMRGLPRYTPLGIIWLALWGVLILCIVLQQFCWYRVFAVLIGVLFALAVLYSLVVWIVAAVSFAHAKKYIFAREHMDADDIVALPDPEFSWLKATVLSNFGQYFMFECLSSASLCLISIFSMLYAFYSVFTKKPPAAAKSKKDAAEQAHHADEEVGLRHEEMP